MKYTVLAIALSFMFVACGSENTEQSEGNAAGEPVEMEAPVAENAKKDPVCGMLYNDAWTAHSVNGNDTVWFCSEGCKMAYDARPEKYNKKEG